MLTKPIKFEDYIRVEYFIPIVLVFTLKPGRRLGLPHGQLIR